VLPIEEMAALDYTKLKVFSVNLDTQEVELTEVVEPVFSHDFEGEWVVNEQNGSTVTTTPNHSVYNEDYETFYPGEDSTSNILQKSIPYYLIDGKPQTIRWTKFFRRLGSDYNLVNRVADRMGATVHTVDYSPRPDSEAA
jgi:hypothetical protein